jgi:hypothetical protein
MKTTDKMYVYEDNRLIIRWRHTGRQAVYSQRKRLPNWMYEKYPDIKIITELYMKNGAVAAVRHLKDSRNLSLKEAYAFLNELRGGIMKKIKTSFGEVTIEYAKYSNGRTAVQLFLQEGKLLATLTVNLPEEHLGPGEFFVKGWSENAKIIEECRPHFIDTGKRVSTRFVTAEVWKERKYED